MSIKKIIQSKLAALESERLLLLADLRALEQIERRYEESDDSANFVSLSDAATRMIPDRNSEQLPLSGFAVKTKEEAVIKILNEVNPKSLNARQIAKLLLNKGYETEMEMSKFSHTIAVTAVRLFKKGLIDKERNGFYRAKKTDW